MTCDGCHLLWEAVVYLSREAVKRIGVLLVVFVSLAASAIVFGYSADPASAHRSWCHGQHTCPSDHASYRWGPNKLLCVRPTSEWRTARFDTRVIYDGLLYFCEAAAKATPTQPTTSFTYKGTVTYIVDGDTFDVRIGSRTERIRVIGIDTPERGVCFANAATAAATRLASGKPVVLRGDPTQATRDRYGRLLAYVGLPKGKDLGYQLIAGGFAKVYVYDNHPFQRVTSYRAAEAIGKRLGSSLWRCGTT